MFINSFELFINYLTGQLKKSKSFFLQIIFKIREKCFVLKQNRSNMFCLLDKFVKRYCLISASFVPSEAAFSIANYLQRRERSAMSSKMLRISIVMKETYSEEQLKYLNESK